MKSKTATVSLAACREYDADLASAVGRALVPLGGLNAFVKPGFRVLIKPNLLTARAPEEAVTTHPEMVRVVIRMVRECGGRPMVGDSPANVVSVEKVWEKTGIGRVCEEEKAPLINFEKAGAVPVRLDGVSFAVAAPALEADVVINLPKVKTHMLTVLTAAVKNLYGVLPGYQKTLLHRDHPSPSEFGVLLAAIYKRLRPALNIADGIAGMEGDGPTAGRPIRLGFIAASSDAAALDAGLCSILGIALRHVAYLDQILKEAAFGSGFRFAGENVDRIRPSSFQKPAAWRGRMIPGGIVRMIGRFFWIRPVFMDKCVSCGQCVRACPAGALAMSAVGRPVLDKDACLGCCCCHEVCPERAIRMVGSALFRLVNRKGGP